jgi:hypothetical protein
MKKLMLLFPVFVVLAVSMQVQAQEIVQDVPEEFVEEVAVPWDPVTEGRVYDPSQEIMAFQHQWGLQTAQAASATVADVFRNEHILRIPLTATRRLRNMIFFRPIRIEEAVEATWNSVSVGRGNNSRSRSVSRFTSVSRRTGVRYLTFRILGVPLTDDGNYAVRLRSPRGVVSTFSWVAVPRLRIRGAEWQMIRADHLRYFNTGL